MEVGRGLSPSLQVLQPWRGSCGCRSAPGGGLSAAVVLAAAGAQRSGGWEVQRFDGWYNNLQHRGRAAAGECRRAPTPREPFLTRACSPTGQCPLPWPREPRRGPRRPQEQPGAGARSQLCLPRPGLATSASARAPPAAQRGRRRTEGPAAGTGRTQLCPGGLPGITGLGQSIFRKAQQADPAAFRGRGLPGPGTLDLLLCSSQGSCWDAGVLHSTDCSALGQACRISPCQG